MNRSLQILLTLPLVAVALDPKPLTDEIFNALAENGIGDVLPDKAEKFQQAILDALSEGGEEIVGLEITPANPKGGDEKPAAFTVKQLFNNDNAAVSFSIDNFNGNLKNALDDLNGFIAEKKAKALLIDLRVSGGDDENAARQFVEFCKECKVPLGVLVDGCTHAMAEAILPELKAAGATFFGSPTAGRPGPRKSVKLANGAVLHIPQKKSKSVVPDVTIPEDATWQQFASDFLIAKSVIMAP